MEPAVTDSKTVVEDLGSWLTSIWDEEERLARDEVEVAEHVYDSSEFTVEYQWARMTRHTSGGWGQSFAPSAPSPASVLARIAADRKILALHAIGQDPCDAHDGVTMRSVACDTVRLLAEPNADKPGFRSEWLVERQGVEQ